VPELLTRLGIRTLGAFAALDRGAVASRFGEDGLRLHDLARGVDPIGPAGTAPPPDLARHVELDPPVTNVDVAAFAAKRLADQLLAEIADRGLGCTRVVIEAVDTDGRTFSRCWSHDGAFGAAALAQRTRWQLDTWLTSMPVTGDFDPDLATGGLVSLRLVPDEIVPVGSRQLGFWGADRTAGDRAERALARLQGMLGHDAVAAPVLQGGRTPGEQVRWVPWGDPREPLHPVEVDGEIVPWPGAVPAPAPSRVFTPGLPAMLVDGRGHHVVVSGRGRPSAPPTSLRCAALPGGGGAVVAWSGPWPHDVRWWDERTRRRLALWQVVVDAGSGGQVACLVATEADHARVEALYD
jgi:protein ImuB